MSCCHTAVTLTEQKMDIDDNRSVAGGGEELDSAEVQCRVVHCELDFIRELARSSPLKSRCLASCSNLGGHGSHIPRSLCSFLLSPCAPLFLSIPSVIFFFFLFFNIRLQNFRNSVISIFMKVVRPCRAPYNLPACCPAHSNLPASPPDMHILHTLQCLQCTQHGTANGVTPQGRRFWTDCSRL